MGRWMDVWMDGYMGGWTDVRRRQWWQVQEGVPWWKERTEDRQMAP